MDVGGMSKEILDFFKRNVGFVPSFIPEPKSGA
jgi:hypothetical protein